MIHQYKNNGYNIIIDANSGCIHSVDDVAYDIIKLVDEGIGDAQLIFNEIKDKYNDITIDDVTETLEDIELLKKEGKLFSDDIFRDLAPYMKDKQSVLKAICLHVAHDCNMNCGYCFAGKGEYNGPKGLMTFETAKKAIDFLVEHSPGRRNLEVDFFGGEPLLNWEVCKKTVEYARSIEKEKNKNFRFTLTTNGLLIDDDVIEFSNKEIGNVVLSLDGRPEINDNMRKTKNGKGTYNLIIDKFKKFADSRNQKDYYMRGTYTKYNRDFAKDIIHMADLGFKELSMEPVVCSPDMPYALTEEDIPVLKENYDILAREMIKRYKDGNGFNFYHYTIDFTGGPCISKRISGCGVGTEYLAITPEGDIYPCHQFVGDDKYKMGNLDDGITKGEIVSEFKGCNVYSRKECDDCFAKLYCSGGCSANAYHMNGDVKTVCEFSCELHKKRIECAVMMNVALNE